MNVWIEASESKEETERERGKKWNGTELKADKKFLRCSHGITENTVMLLVFVYP